MRLTKNMPVWVFFRGQHYKANFKTYRANGLCLVYIPDLCEFQTIPRSFVKNRKAVA